MSGGTTRKTVVINQPNYLPTMHYFEQIIKSDYFVIYDDVQYTRGDWRNRNRIRIAGGWQWLTVPVINAAGQMIKDTKIDNHTPWRRNHMKSIELQYKKAPFFEQYWPELKEIYEQEWASLPELDVEIMLKLCSMLNIKPNFIFSSKLCIKGERTERLLNICIYLDADKYYSPAASRTYLDISKFYDAGIKVEFQRYKHPIYLQMHKGFQPYMSVIDLLFNYGKSSKGVIIS